ncbi:hypothetical protein BgiMline_023822 [Biomphalaria glabrata]|nr:hypothetical protein BgiMline_007058 [Biomphalaria glabrata]
MDNRLFISIVQACHLKRTRRLDDLWGPLHRLTTAQQLKHMMKYSRRLRPIGSTEPPRVLVHHSSLEVSVRMVKSSDNLSVQVSRL